MPGSPIRVTHIVFDVDGTLVDWDGAYLAALEATASHASELCGTLVSPTQLRQVRDLVYAEPAWRGRTLREVRDESLRRVLEAADVRDPDALAALSATYYRVRDEAMQPYPDVEPALRELCERGFTLVAASNGNSALDAQAFFPYLYAVHHAEVAGISKPDPRFFLGALGAAGGRPEAALSVGDRIENDYEPALSLGMHALLLDRPGGVSDAAVRRIGSLAELPGMVELAPSVE